MVSVNITNFRKSIFSILEQTIKHNEHVSVNTKAGNAVIMSEDDYNGLMETLHLSSMIKETITEGLKTPLSECVSEDKVIW
ncbi:MAG: type II toxin-antitoxin system Phd/YefM family antitoxin [Campylobacteraceae bacterium]|jgi:PHD/YefM family antitoxin component YafN of YafNO toxin-antitoxin module|nr:type II toxin-antitoxin system Phd/YefM family antitoxin [Campylobacteraceae bacterium]